MNNRDNNTNNTNTIDQTQKNHQDNNQTTQEDLKQKEYENNLKECQDRYNYLIAEFENYKKRNEKERLNWISHAQDTVILDILNIIDNYERALKEIEKSNLSKELLAYLQGFKMIYKDLQKLLEKYNVEEVKSDKFDPQIHEAIISSESENHKSGDIINILEKGYTRNNKIIRAAKVEVAK
jgi:molecular chaperone GrpE